MHPSSGTTIYGALMSTLMLIKTLRANDAEVCAAAINEAPDPSHKRLGFNSKNLSTSDVAN